MYPDVLCIIPARGGSQGIKNKNLKQLYNLPLVEHSIRHAILAGFELERIVVSSDSQSILNIAVSNRVVAAQRPDEISGPESSTEETLLWELDHHRRYCSSRDLGSCSHVLLLQATSPIRFKSTIPDFIRFYKNGGYDSALTTTKFYNFFWQTGSPATSSYDPMNRPMRQNMTEADYRHFDNGNMYLTNVAVLESRRCRLGNNVGLFPVSEIEGMQIDTRKELDIFRAIFTDEIAHMTGIS